MDALRIEEVRTFVCVAETGGFTAAGTLLGATQSAISVRIRKLEERVGRPLLARTPREVALTADGEAFLREARLLLELHDRIMRRFKVESPPLALRLGVSDNAAGVRLPSILAMLSRVLVDVRLHVEVGMSEELSQEFQAGMFEACVLRDPPPGLIARPLFAERLRWYAAKRFVLGRSAPVPLIVLSHRCRIRDVAIDVLDGCGRTWTEVLIGGSVAAVRAAVSAGMGVACLGDHNAPDDSRDVGTEFALPTVASRSFALAARGLDESVVDALAEAFRRPEAALAIPPR